MDLTQFAAASFIIIGLVNGIQLALDKEWKSFAKFMAAVVGATVFGALHWFGLPSAEVGLAVGISSSGIYKIAQKISGNA